MAFFQDFSVCNYFDSSTWLCRFMAVGWIEHGKDYNRGPEPEQLVEKLVELRRDFSNTFPEFNTRGLHTCSLCKELGTFAAPLPQSNTNLLVPHRGFVFLAPGAIDHYIKTHGYLPPESFIEAALACPPPSSAMYRELLRQSNRGVEAPLYGAS